MPPSSRHTFASRAPAACAIQRPTAVEPVKLMRSTSGDSTSAAPASSPSPCTTLSTPGGRPASCASRAKAHALSGVSSAGLSTAAFPQRSAGKTFHATLAIGVFAAMMRPVTPTGWRTVSRGLVGDRAGGGATVEPATFAGDEHPHLDRGAGLAPGILERLAGLLRDQAGQLLLSVPHQERDGPQVIPPAHHGARRPARLGAARGGHRRPHVLGPRARHFGDHPAVARARASRSGRRRACRLPCRR